jgi:3-methyladenine DNA glycosylase AlkC
MAEPLKNSYGPEIPTRIAAMIRGVYPEFPTESFLADVLDGYEALELMPRGRHISKALRRHLPENYETACEILINSLGPANNKTESNGMTVFQYMPHANFVADYGLDYFELSMRAQYEITQRFTAEFSIRPYLIHHTAKTLARLREWTADENVHVRRLVSEGTRPRLPWASRLSAFQKDPSPVLELLELLKDDPEIYVRRSVANNLNDIGKDNPAVLLETARRWMTDASPERRALIRHALRSLIKAGDPGALGILGFGAQTGAQIRNASITPALAHSGERIMVTFEIVNESPDAQRVLVDFRIHYVKANGKTAPKVFKLKALELAPQEAVEVRKTVSLAEMTTRKHYAGRHEVDALLNGQIVPLGAFDLNG